MAPPITAPFDWILAITTIAFCFATFGNGANDVANAYATSVAARTLTMPQVGFLATLTEFTGAVGLGSRVTSTIKNNIIDVTRYNGEPAAFLLVMGCAEVANATWLMFATKWGMPVSTTHTIVGSLVGAGIASGAAVNIQWSKGSLSQIVASWFISPCIAAFFSALLFGSVKYAVLEREESFKWAMRLIPLYLAGTGAILALFIVVEAPTAPSLEEFGAGKATGIMLGTFFGLLFIAYVFFMPYFERRLIKEDPRIRFYHVPLGPLLRRENPPLYFPGKGDKFVTDYYENAFTENAAIDEQQKRAQDGSKDSDAVPNIDDTEKKIEPPQKKKIITPHMRFLDPVRHLSWFNPKKYWGYTKFVLLQGVTREVVAHDSKLLWAIHSRAKKYDVRVEHLWTYCQVVSAMLMSIAHGSNDVANAVGPWAAVYDTYRLGVTTTKAPTPVWILCIAGLLLGAGFWFYGYKIMRAMGNKITQMSPTRGFACELGAAITVLIASRLGLPVSTTMTLTGSVLGVALMNFDFGAVNWRQLAFIFMGWCLTLPCAGLLSGCLTAMALYAPNFANV